MLWYMEKKEKEKVYDFYMNIFMKMHNLIFWIYKKKEKWNKFFKNLKIKLRKVNTSMKKIMNLLILDIFRFFNFENNDVR